MTPHMEALAFRIWAYAKPRGWKCSYAEIAEGADISDGMVAHVISAKGWKGRVPQGGNLSYNRSVSCSSMPNLEGMYASRYRKGQNIDQNLLSVDKLMR